MGNGYVYFSQFIDLDIVMQILLDNLDGEVLVELCYLCFVIGCCWKFWNCNVVVIGLFVGFMEFLEFISLYFIQFGIMCFLVLFLISGDIILVVCEFNCVIVEEYECICDFIILYYMVMMCDDVELWCYVLVMEILDMLVYKIEYFW